MSNRYGISRLIGKGRTGGVYEAHDSVLNRPIALRRFFSEGGNSDMSDYRTEFDNLHTILTTWKHPNLATVYSGGVDEDGAFIATELVYGKLLENRLNEGRFGLREFFEFAIDVLEGLRLPHSHNFAHGGLNTNSIILEQQVQGGQRARIIDLGLAHMIPLINPGNLRLAFSDPALMAPELFEGQMATPASDVYMCGNLFYLCLAGGHPVSGLPLDEAYDKHAAHAFAPVTGYRASCPPQIGQWIELLTQANPLNRPQNAMEALSIMPKIHEISPGFFEEEDFAHTMPAPQEGYYGVEQNYADHNGMYGPAATPSMYGSAVTPAVSRGGALGGRQIPKVLASNGGSRSAAPAVISVIVGVILFVGLLAMNRGGKTKTSRTNDYSHDAETFNERFKGDSDSETSSNGLPNVSILDSIDSETTLEDPDLYTTDRVTVDPLGASAGPKVKAGVSSLEAEQADKEQEEVKVPELTLDLGGVEFEATDTYQLEAPTDSEAIAYATSNVTLEFAPSNVTYGEHKTLFVSSSTAQHLSESRVADWMIQNGEDLIVHPSAKYGIERSSVGEFEAGKIERETTLQYRSSHFVPQGGYSYWPYTGFSDGCGFKYTMTVPAEHVGPLRVKLHTEEVGLELIYELNRSSKSHTSRILVSEKVTFCTGHVGIFEIADPQEGETISFTVLSNKLSTNEEDVAFGSPALIVLKNH